MTESKPNQKPQTSTNTLLATVSESESSNETLLNLYIKYQEFVGHEALCNLRDKIVEFNNELDELKLKDKVVEGYATVFQPNLKLLSDVIHSNIKTLRTYYGSDGERIQSYTPYVLNNHIKTKHLSFSEYENK